MTHTPTATRRRNHRQAGQAQDQELLPEVVAAVRAAGATLAGRFAADARPASSQTLLAAIESNDSAALRVLRPALERARAGVGWVDDEEETGLLPAGEWWVVDPVEGNVNHIHGLTDWGVTATLVRDNTPVLAVVHLPVTGTTYTALRDVGAYQDGTRLHVSAKTELTAALVGTGQAMPGEDPRTYQRIGSSVTAMLQAALVTRVSVPATLQLTEVAAGRMDAFWQYSAVRTGLLAGALLVTEAGGTVTDTHGNPWTPTSQDVLAVSPGLHPAAVQVLSTVA